MLRARLLVSQGRLDAAIKVLDSSPELGPEAAKLRAAIKLGSSTDPGELKKQLENDPKNAVVLGRLCTMLRTSEPEAAMRYCRQASELEPDNVGHAVGFASALLQTKRYEDAVSVLSRLADHVPDNATVRANLATGLFQLGRFADAEIASLSEADLDDYERLLDVPDHDLYLWVTGEAPAPDEFLSPLLSRIQTFHAARKADR